MGAVRLMARRAGLAFIILVYGGLALAVTVKLVTPAAPVGCAGLAVRLDEFNRELPPAEADESRRIALAALGCKP